MNAETTMKTPPVVTAAEWEAARQRLLVHEKELTRARDALAAQRRRMPWVEVEKPYELAGQPARSACSSCSGAGVSWSSTAPSSSPAWSAGPITPATAVR